MPTDRMEAFSDGVLAIIITIMVLELKVPHGSDWGAIRPLLPIFATYVMSFVYVGIYWNNHHHLLHATDRVDGRVLWANLHLLFWLSLFPLVTGWMGENHFTPLPTAVYGMVLVLAAFAWLILQAAILHVTNSNARLRETIGRDRKGKISVAIYAAAVGLAFVWPVVSVVLYVLVACLWLMPDRRFEEELGEP